MGLANSSVVCGPAALTSLGSLLEMQNLKFQPRPTESDTGDVAWQYVLYQALQMILMHLKV